MPPGERPLDHHEVGAGLGERGTAVAQHRRGMQHGDQDRAVAERELAPAELRVIPSFVCNSSLVAKFPSVTTTAGSMKPSCASRYGRQVSISTGSGSRLPGGRHFTTFAM